MFFFSVAECEQRAAAVQELMKREDIDTLVIHRPENIAWLSGFWHDGFFAYHALVIGQSGEPRLVGRALENPVAEELSWVNERHNYWDGEDPYAFLAEAVRAVTPASHARIGLEFDSQFLWLDRFEHVRRVLDGHDLVSSARIVERLQQIKSPAELDYMRQAGVIASAAVAAGIEAAQVGASEQDLAAAIATAQAQNRHAMVSWVGWAAQFARAGAPFNCTGNSSTAQLRQATDSGSNSAAYINSIEPNRNAQALLVLVIAGVEKASEIVTAAQDDGISRMGPGVPAREIAAACRKPLLHAGLVDRYDNRVGYGLGIQFHPTSGDFSLDIDARSDYELQPGMVFHMLLFAGGAAMSETVAVTESGHEVLTNNPREFFTRYDIDHVQNCCDHFARRNYLVHTGRRLVRGAAHPHRRRYARKLRAHRFTC